MDNQIKKSSPWDVFMYLLATITLYFSVYSVINLLLEYINAGFPDALNPYYNGGDSIRWSLALLIIIFPVYFWVSRVLYKDVAGDSGKREIRIRKWLLYFTLFLAALLIIGDLVALIYNFLQGEITMRFLLKVLSVLVVAAGVFGYYLYDLRRETGIFSSKAKIFVWSVAAAVAVVVFAGFFVAGSPFKQRLVRFDNQRVSDLQTIQSQIVYYWQQKNQLPSVLDDLRDSISGFVPPKDPQSGAAYRYNVTGKLSFELCAEFNLSSAASRIDGSVPKAMPATPPFGYYQGAYETDETWDHGAGSQCFSRSIDPELYRQKPLSTP